MNRITRMSLAVVAAMGCAVPNVRGQMESKASATTNIGRYGFRYDPKQFIRGGFLDWIYHDLGIFSFSTELWDAIKTAGIEERDIIKFMMYERTAEDEKTMLDWSDKEHVR